MKKLSILAISSVLLASTAFAVAKPEAKQPKAEKQPVTATVQVAGKTIATLQMVDGVVLSFEARTDEKVEKVQLVYDPAKDVIIHKGNCTLEARQGDKRLLKLDVDDGVVTIGPAKGMAQFFEKSFIEELLKSKAK